MRNPVIFTNNSSTISLAKSLVQQKCKPCAYVDSRNEKDIENDVKEYLIKK